MDDAAWEQVHGKEALEHVVRWNSATIAKFEAHPRFEAIRKSDLALLEAQDRIAHPIFPVGTEELVHNYWTGPENPKGFLRSTTLEDFCANDGSNSGGDAATWRTILDIDKLSRDEGENWVYGGMSFHWPECRRAIVHLSRDGKDASVMREFDLERGAFVETEDAFRFLEESKSAVSWESEDSLLVSDAFSDETRTESGYARVVRRVARGSSLSDLSKAPVLFAGQRSDMSVGAGRWNGTDAEGNVIWVTTITRSPTFHTSESFWLAPGRTAGKEGDENELVRVPVPDKCSATTIFRGQFVFETHEDWRGHPAGSVLSFDWFDWTRTRATEPELFVVWAPDPARDGGRISLSGVSASKSTLLLTLMRDVLLETHTRRWDAKSSSWKGRHLHEWQEEEREAHKSKKRKEERQQQEAGGGNDRTVTTSVCCASEETNVVFLSREGFLTPESLWRVDFGDDGEPLGAPCPVRACPARFDGSGLVAEQRFATSRDGTRVPYFLIRPAASFSSGGGEPMPTQLYGYGGFESGLTPSYGAGARDWLFDDVEGATFRKVAGRCFAVANIRGGNEYGPAWHQAGLKTKRQVVYDDFIAVAEDLVASGVTSPERLACRGGSNGGLLVGCMYAQRPDLFGAIVCEAPLLDMLRFHKLLAGASWIDEYGDPDDPEEGRFLRTISPLHNVDPAAQHPPILFLTSTADDRVHPAHARKMAALLESLGEKKPFWFFERIDGGHAGGVDNHASAHEKALRIVFLLETIAAPNNNK